MYFTKRYCFAQIVQLKRLIYKSATVSASESELSCALKYVFPSKYTTPQFVAQSVLLKEVIHKFVYKNYNTNCITQRVYIQIVLHKLFMYKKFNTNCITKKSLTKIV